MFSRQIISQYIIVLSTGSVVNNNFKYETTKPTIFSGPKG